MIKCFDLKCKDCGHVWTDYLESTHDIFVSPECPECGKNFVVRLPGGLKYHHVAEPYDLLRKGPDVGKKIFSGPKVHSK